MQKLNGKLTPILLIIETAVLVVIIFAGILAYKSKYTETEIFRESSQGGQYTVKRDRTCESDWSS